MVLLTSTKPHVNEAVGASRPHDRAQQGVSSHMRSQLFDAANAEVNTGERWVKQNSKMVKVTLGGDVLAVKGSMVAYQGQVTFTHQGAGSVGKMIRRALTNEDFRGRFQLIDVG